MRDTSGTSSRQLRCNSVREVVYGVYGFGSVKRFGKMKGRKAMLVVDMEWALQNRDFDNVEMTIQNLRFDWFMMERIVK